MRQRAWSTAIEGTRDLSEWALYSTSYLLTGACPLAALRGLGEKHVSPAVHGGGGMPSAQHGGMLYAGWFAATTLQLAHRALPCPPAHPPACAGNLLAPYVTACTSDLLFSIYQRLKAQKVRRAGCAEWSPRARKW